MVCLVTHTANGRGQKQQFGEVMPDTGFDLGVV